VPDKRQIAASFSRAAKSYDSAAALQRQIGQRLLNRLPLPSPPAPLPQVGEGGRLPATFPLSPEMGNFPLTEETQPHSPRPLAGEGLGERAETAERARGNQRWLDIGCGSGYFTRELARRYPNAEGHALDIAQGMLLHAKSQGGAAHWIAADAENLPFADNAFDLLFSNLCLQWCQDLRQVLSEAKRCLRPGGLFAFSSLASGTLAELQSAWQSVDNFTHVNRFRRFADYQSACAESGLKAHHLSGQAELRHYLGLKDLTCELKALGAHNLNPNRAAGLGGRKRLTAMSRAYQRLQNEQGLPATWQVVYAVLQKEP